MVPKGWREVDGFQRFSCPPLNKMLAQPKVAPSVTCVTIPPTPPINDAVASGKQSGRKPCTEDTANAHSKRQPIKFGNLTKRPGRGYAALYLTLTFAIVTSDPKRIVTFFKAEAHRIEDAKTESSVKHRTRRRHDARGTPLVRSGRESPPGPLTNPDALYQRRTNTIRPA